MMIEAVNAVNVCGRCRENISRVVPASPLSAASHGNRLLWGNRRPAMNFHAICGLPWSILEIHRSPLNYRTLNCRIPLNCHKNRGTKCVPSLYETA